MHNLSIIQHFLVQLIVILAACNMVSYIGTRFLAQSRVVCEMLAGVILGPTILGFIAPNLTAWLFPHQDLVLQNKTLITNPSMQILYVLGQLGLILMRIQSQKTNTVFHCHQDNKSRTPLRWARARLRSRE
ncbi:MAG: hypothetical protein A3F18_03410 [Legionellales bacterium RIFCSPHIGHO2_12_FULL_37_14]|nr:MAG: hypothetical protein A3F18_03410 [Legionellales bacterium RIFCSPHIGHO2_12_FULL_37_14]